MRRASIVIQCALWWGALVFGAVYPWAYWPLFAACGAAGVLAGGAHGRGAFRAPERLLAGALALLAAAVVIQLVPVPRATLDRVSPGTVRFLNHMAVGYAQDSGVWHAVSIAPFETLRALVFLVALSVLMIGLAYGLTARRAETIAASIAALGAALAVIGIVQKPFYAGRLYGFWRPYGLGAPFGPFVNKNHFAGWMLMALPLTIGYMIAQISAALSCPVRDWRQRLLWWASPRASRALLSLFSVAVMALSLVMTLSRSAITAFLLMLIAASLMAVRRLDGAWRKTLAIGTLSVLGIFAVEWTGFDAVYDRMFMSGRMSLTGGRTTAWTAALEILHDFRWTGSGLNTYGVATVSYQTTELERHYAQAHNDYLQLASEGGLLLVLPSILVVAIFVGTVKHRMAEADKIRIDWLRLGAVGGLFAIAIQEVGDFSLQIPANAALFTVLCGIAISRSSIPSNRHELKTT